MLSPLLTTQEVAAILRVNVRTVQRMVRERRIPVCIGAGKHWRFAEEDVAKYIRDTTVLASERPHVVRKSRQHHGNFFTP